MICIIYLTFTLYIQIGHGPVVLLLEGFFRVRRPNALCSFLGFINRLCQQNVWIDKPIGLQIFNRFIKQVPNRKSVSVKTKKAILDSWPRVQIFLHLSTTRGQKCGGLSQKRFIIKDHFR